MIDLGTIIMKNQFSEISQPNESKTLTMDKITLFLYKLHVTRLVYYRTRKVGIIELSLPIYQGSA
jgi:hypothetical protein